MTLVVRSQVEPPEPCAETAAFGDTLHIHYTVRAGRGRAGGAWRGRRPLKHVSLGSDTWQAVCQERLGLRARLLPAHFPGAFPPVPPQHLETEGGEIFEKRQPFGVSCSFLPPVVGGGGRCR